MENQPKIIIYTGSICIHCHNVKEFLTENGYEFEERSISIKENKTEVLAMGYFGIPVTIIDGEEIQGDDLKKIEEIIKRKMT